MRTFRSGDCKGDNDDGIFAEETFFRKHFEVLIVTMNAIGLTVLLIIVGCGFYHAKLRMDTKNKFLNNSYKKGSHTKQKTPLIRQSSP